MIRLVVMMYVKYPLSLRNVEDLLFERGMSCGGTFGRGAIEALSLVPNAAAMEKG